MTPNPTDQDVAALVARLREAHQDSAQRIVGSNIFDEAATALSTLAAERDEDKREATAYHGYWIEERDKRIASEARATALEAERDRVRLLVDHERGERTKDAAEYAALEAQLARAREALEPFANCIFNDNGDITVSPRQFSSDELIAAYFARKALRPPAPADGRGEDDRVASASCPHEPAARRVRHRVRGTNYEVLGEGETQISEGVHNSRRLVEGDALTVYRCIETGKLWLRFPDEFEDGRFDDIPAPPLGTGRGLADANQKITQTGDRDE